MGQFTRIASFFELPPEGEVREFPFLNGTVCVANADGNFAGLGSICPHKGGPLAEGSVESGKLICPWHGWEFRLSDGRCINHSAASVQVFELVIQGEDVFLKS
jgi:nitrite reductase/ring-hydroxylating ferredoxin subunit